MAGGLEALIGKTIRKVMNALKSVDYAFIGGVAVYAHGYRRSTEDADVGICAPIRSLGALMERGGFRYKGGIRFLDPETGVTVDLFRVPRKFLPFLQHPESKILDSFEVPVIPPEMLLAMKMRAGRGKDEADVIELHKRHLKYDARRVSRWLADLEAAGDKGVRKRFDALKERAKRELRDQKRMEEEQLRDDGSEE